ncbi:MAG: HD domain-containing protein [Chloroflexota bacterium]
MKEAYTQIYLASRPYWDTRFNDIHVPLAHEYARQLLVAYPEANEAVVISAILMHDNGWKMLTPEQQAKSFGPNMSRADLRRQHELEGVRIAGEILAEIGYDTALTAEILDIIDGHDSRETAVSLNDQLVKDADKLWRFAPTGLDIDHRRFGKELQAHARWAREQIDDWLFTDAAKRLALDLVNLTIVD